MQNALPLYLVAQRRRKPAGLYLLICFYCNLDELTHAGLTGATEVKFENSITRTTAEANPRQIERVVRGAKFPLQLIYEVTDEVSPRSR